jgi:hypothetical protein
MIGNHRERQRAFAQLIDRYVIEVGMEKSSAPFTGQRVFAGPARPNHSFNQAVSAGANAEPSMDREGRVAQSIHAEHPQRHEHAGTQSLIGVG